MGAIIPASIVREVPFEDDQAPPPHAIQRKVHPAPINEPALLPMRRFGRVRPPLLSTSPAQGSASNRDHAFRPPWAERRAYTGSCSLYSSRGHRVGMT